VFRSRILVAVLLAALLLPTVPQGVWGGEARAAGNPLAGIEFVPAPYSPLNGDHADHAAYAAFKASRPGDAALLEQHVFSKQMAEWIVSREWQTWMNPYIDQLFALYKRSSPNAVPLFVAYNVPYLNCAAGNGAANGDAYRRWIENFVAAINGRKAIIVVEPDGLSVPINCGMSEAQRNERYSLIAYAVAAFKRNPNAIVYIDGGENGRNTPQEIATILQAGGIAQADGFFLNATMYQHTTLEVAHGRQISALLGGKHFIVDTSRNGLGTDGEGYCNAPGRALGVSPTTQTGDELVDAYVWIKRVWESDDTCGRNEPRGGRPYWDYALGLTYRAITPFSDMPADPEAHEAVRHLALLGVIRGNDDGTLGPNAFTLRAQMAALIARPLFWELDQHGNSFPDQGSVDRDLWRNVNTLARYGVAKGYSDGTYNPTGEVLYVQTILFISRGMVQAGYWKQQPDVQGYFPNIPANTDREKADRSDLATYVFYTENYGGIPGSPARGNFVAYDQPAPRAWFAVALHRALRSAYLP
jgi:endoglucanase